jgi:hypothetical protein
MSDTRAYSDQCKTESLFCLAKHEKKVFKFFILIIPEVQLEVKEKRSKGASAVHCLKKRHLQTIIFALWTKLCFFEKKGKRVKK